MFDHRNFFCLRDFYYLCKKLGQNFHKFLNYSEEEALEVICSCIDSNFSGNMAKITDPKSKKSILSNLLFKKNYIKLYQIDKSKKKTLDFKKILVKKPEIFKNIETSLRTKGNRFLMIFTENGLCRDFVKRKLKEILKNNFKEKEIVHFEGSQFQHDQDSPEYTKLILSKLKSHIQKGDQVIMEKMDNIYSLLYDLFNQHFEIEKDKRMCSIIYEDHVDKFEINEDFRCVLLKSKSEMIQEQNPGQNLEILLPSPLLNRMEKYLIHYEDLYDNARVEVVKKIIIDLKEALTGKAFKIAQDQKMNFEWKLNDLIFCYNNGELVQLITNQVFEEIGSSEDIFYKNTKERLIKEVQSKILKYFSSSMFMIQSVNLRDNHKKFQEFVKNYEELEKIESISSLYNKINEWKLNKFVIFTMAQYINFELNYKEIK